MVSWLLNKEKFTLYIAILWDTYCEIMIMHNEFQMNQYGEWILRNLDDLFADFHRYSYEVRTSL